MPPYPAALALTLAVEVPLYAVALRAGWRVPWPRAATVAVAVNLVTHPVLWSVLWQVRGAGSYPVLLAAAEVAVCAAEAALLAWWLRRPDRLLAVLAVGVNAVSVLAGFISASV
ncbi:hypothetical protein QEZ54_10020 [Catellatospora sp. KI3]|uniref:hypothetical protein n=1 Tax=Catellatospora sp. KI3 TaxID=3041620 RepID=UPI002483071E|nr:hypothetical protein [Catellatospora sp. KI3]MDI1461303.1 hypothetical protein [Catellatospora sp. KI3]